MAPKGTPTPPAQVYADMITDERLKSLAIYLCHCQIGAATIGGPMHMAADAAGEIVGYLFELDRLGHLGETEA